MKISTQIHNAKKNEIGWHVPYHIMLAVLVFLIINSITILNVKGVVDDVGYKWQNAHYIPVNTYHDEGRFYVYGSIGFRNWREANREEALINMGGPTVHIVRFLLWAGDKTGIVKTFEDPYTYYFYPEEYLRIWKFIGLYKVWLFLIWLPIVVYWIGARHFSKITGLLAVWLTISIPFITGYEPRLKPDTIAIMLGLFSILWQLEFTRTCSNLHLFLAAIFLGISFAVRFNMAPVGITLFLAYAIVSKKQAQSPFDYKTWKNFCLVIGITILSFVIANPPAIGGFVHWVMSAFQKYVFAGEQKYYGIRIILESIWYRILHFDSHFGTVLNWMVIPSIIFAFINLFYERGYKRISLSFVLVFLFGYFIYIAFLVQGRVVFLTYYYYAAAIVLLIIISNMLSALYEKAALVSRIALFAVGMAVFFIVGFTAYENSRVFTHMVSKTNRQEMYAWFEKNIPQGAVVGIPIFPTHSFFDQWIQLDPFKYRLVHIGKQGELLEGNKPDYFIWILFSKDSPKINRSDYKIIAEFSRGADLPHERYDLYQEEQFIVYKRNNTEIDISQRSILGEMERQLGVFMKADAEDEFRILQFQSISFMPLWLNLLRKTDYSLHYDSHLSFEGSIRGDMPEHAKYAYIHQVDPTMLQLWGVKYVLARMNMGDDSPFERHVLQSGRYNLKEINRYKTLFGEEKRDVGLFYNNEYRGQIFFAKYGEGEYRRKPFYKRIWEYLFDRKKTVQGVLYDSEKIKRMGANNIAVYMKVKSSAPATITVRGGGNEESWGIAKGVQTVWMPYRIFNPDEPVVYEINSVKKRGKIYAEEVYAMPLFLYSDQAISNAKISKRGGAVSVNADKDGEIIFSLPYHKYWKAKVDGVSVPVKKGLAGTVAVGAPQGRHLVEVYFN